ncbi:jg5228, partial [Pararge aegeria aegeria]
DRPNDRPDILDIALLKNIALEVYSLEVLSELCSDHRPVQLQLGPLPTEAPPSRTIIDYKTLAEHLKSKESEHLSRIPDTIDSLEDARVASQHLVNHIGHSVSISSRVMPIGPVRRPLPDEARQLITNKNRLQRAHDKCPNRRNRRLLWKAQRELLDNLKLLRDDKWDRFLGELRPSHVEYYKLARSLSQSNRVAATPPLLRPDQPPAFDDIDKAECLADSLEAQCSPSTISIDRTQVLKVESELETLFSLPPDGDPLPPTTCEEVHTIIKGFHSKKAPGPDSINNKTLKLLPGEIINLLVVIFNTFLAHCYFPDSWKEANVIGIPKPGKPRNLPTSYRPISLLNSLAKVFERVILNRLKAVVEERKLLNDQQFGFRAKHSCVHQAHRFTEHVLHGFHSLTSYIPTGAIFFDVAKAFDRVWHEGLLYKLHHLVVRSSQQHLLRNYLTNRTFRYRIDGTLSLYK